MVTSSFRQNQRVNNNIDSITRRKGMPIMKLPGGNLRDEVREPLYDTIDLTPGAITQGVRSFFSDVAGKDITLTNMRQANLLENSVSFRLQGLAVDVQNFYDDNLPVVPLLLENSAISLRIGEKNYWQGPMRYAAGRMWTDLGGTTTTVQQQHGFSAVAGVILTGKHVVDINPLQSFEMSWVLSGLTAAEIVLATVAAGTKLRYVGSLKGLKRRPVQ
jgi:hypothetical protein